MNQAHWLTERLYEDKASQLQQQAENERFAQEAQKEAPQNHSRSILAKYRAELSNLSMKAQNESPKKR